MRTSLFFFFILIPFVSFAQSNFDYYIFETDPEHYPKSIMAFRLDTNKMTFKFCGFNEVGDCAEAEGFVQKNGNKFSFINNMNENSLKASIAFANSEDSCYKIITYFDFEEGFDSLKFYEYTHDNDLFIDDTVQIHLKNYCDTTVYCNKIDSILISISGADYETSNYKVPITPSIIHIFLTFKNKVFRTQFFHEDWDSFKYSEDGGILLNLGADKYQIKKVDKRVYYESLIKYYDIE